MVSRADATACLVKPGRKQANELLKVCRQRIPYGKEHVGQIVSIMDFAPEICWQGWLARQVQTGGIFTSKEPGGEVTVISCFVEAFPEREPYSLYNALIRTGFLAEWRVGIKESGGGGQAIPVDRDAPAIARQRRPPPPTCPHPVPSDDSSQGHMPRFHLLAGGVGVGSSCRYNIARLKSPCAWLPHEADLSRRLLGLSVSALRLGVVTAFAGARFAPREAQRLHPVNSQF